MFENSDNPLPQCVLPKNSVDCHMHIVERNPRFDEAALSKTAAIEQSIARYQKVQQSLGLEKVVLVQSNAYQMDNQVLLEALKHFGSNARGVAAINSQTTDTELESLAAAGVRGARIMALNNGPVGLDQLLSVNAKIHTRGWHSIVQFNGREIIQALPLFKSLQGDYVIDHVGRFTPPVEPDSAEFNAMLTLIDKGNCYVKVAGFYEFSVQGGPSYEDIGTLVRALVRHAPERIIWGSNWPHLMSKTASQCPDDRRLLDLVASWISEDSDIKKVFVDNPTRLYGFIN